METVLENSIPGLSDSIAKIREDVKSGVENLTEECVSTMADVTRLLMKVFIFLVLICAPKCTPIHGSTELWSFSRGSTASGKLGRRQKGFFKPELTSLTFFLCTTNFQSFCDC
ncbi:hypothetical protein IC582_005854 [Cucumis melo]